MNPTLVIILFIYAKQRTVAAAVDVTNQCQQHMNKGALNVAIKTEN